MQLKWWPTIKTSKWTEENELWKKWILQEQMDLQKQFQAEACVKKKPKPTEIGGGKHVVGWKKKN